MKKKILYCGEASYLKTGYGAYSSELLSRLQKTGKYEIIELASYGLINAPEDNLITWKYYANAVPNNDPRAQIYNSNPLNQSGFWRFDRVLLEEKPDIVFSIRDPWVDSFIGLSPHRRHFHYIWMPTCDSLPLNIEWLDIYNRADLILGYTDWQLEELRKLDFKNLHKSAPHCPPEIYQPVPDKKAHKEKLGLPRDAKVIGTVMRNQRRKLFPDLFEAFNHYLQECRSNGNTYLAEKSFLYLHTGYPDIQCWEIPELLQHYNLGNKVLFSYKCKNCKKPFIAFYQGARTPCPGCKQYAGTMVSVGDGLSLQEMVHIYNLFDVYVQYSVAEGFGCPIVESAQCGAVPFAVNITAPTDIIKKLDAYPIEVERTFWSIDEKSIRGLPNNKKFGHQLYEFFNQPEPMRNIKSQTILANAKKHYSWDNTVATWMEAFDMFEPKNTWGEPAKLFKSIPIDPKIPSNYEFTKEAYTKILGKPELIYSYDFAAFVNDLNNGMGRSRGKPTAFTRENLVQYLSSLRERYNQAERERTGQIPLQTEDWIEYAKLKERAR